MHETVCKRLIVTNNPMVYDYNKKNSIVFEERFTFADVLKLARDKIHIGSKLLTHPLSGSVKPYETPYKTVLITEQTGELDTDGLEIIENAIQTAEKFSKNIKKELPDRILLDFQLIDFHLIKEYLD